MPQLVETVGPAWRIGSGGPWSFLMGEEGGVERVGDREVVWARSGPRAVVVGHDGATSPVALILGGAPPAAPERYTVELLTSVTASGGERVWWGCPGCGRRCGKLYLPSGRPRLGCRKCCRLVYLSQYPPHRPKRKRRKRR